MKILIGMTEFVLLGWNGNNININYAKFISQKLELWMFVPCDEDGNVFEEWHDIDNRNVLYDEAKERCLFEGFEMIPYANAVIKENYMIDFDYVENSSIELLLRHEIEFTLTPTALKQIGL